MSTELLYIYRDQSLSPRDWRVWMATPRQIFIWNYESAVQRVTVSSYPKWNSKIIADTRDRLNRCQQILQNVE